MSAPLVVAPSYPLLLLQRSLILACSCGGHWFRHALLEVAGSSLFLLGTAPTEISGFDMVPQRSLGLACSLSSHSLIPVSVEVTDLGLLQRRLLSRVCSSEGCWLRPACTEVTGWGLTPWR